MSENSALYWSFGENHVQSLWKSQLYTGQWRNLSVFLTNGSVRVFTTALAMHFSTSVLLIIPPKNDICIKSHESNHDFLASLVLCQCLWIHIFVYHDQLMLLLGQSPIVPLSLRLIYFLFLLPFNRTI